MADVTATLLNCSLKSSNSVPSSTVRLLGELADQLRAHDVGIDGLIRLADLDVKPSVTSDAGDGDDWPGVRQRILDAEICHRYTDLASWRPSTVLPAPYVVLKP